MIAVSVLILPHFLLQAGIKTQTSYLLCLLCIFRTPTSGHHHKKSYFKKWDAEGHIRIQQKPVLDFNEVINDFYSFIDETKIKPERVVFDPALSAHYWEAFSPFKAEK